MKAWELSVAQQQLSAILEYCAVEPQVICNDQEPLGIVVASPFFQEMYALWMGRGQPTIAELLGELDEIKKVEAIDLEIPSRQDRAWSLPEETNAIAM